MRIVVKTVLEGAGCRTEAARDGIEALGILRLDSGRIVIPDWQMPRMNGVDLCRAVRSKNLPVYL